jgi:hypothetical protein
MVMICMMLKGVYRMTGGGGMTKHLASHRHTLQWKSQHQ